MTLFERLVRSHPAAQVHCLRCRAGVEEVIFHSDPTRYGTRLVVRCHGERTTVDLDPTGPAIRYVKVFEPEPEPLPESSETGVSEIAGYIMPTLKLDSCGGASSSGSCSCGAAGCRTDDRAPGCPGAATKETEMDDQTIENVLEEVRQERLRQEKLKDANADSDADNTQNDWVAFIAAYNGRAAARCYRNEREGQKFRANMLKVAALACAAIESFDRGDAGE